jgi:hypothetical protein
MTEEKDTAPDNGVLEVFSGSASEIMSGIPAPMQKSFFKAFGQLCTAAVDVPVSYLEGKSSENRAESSARVALIKASEQQIAEQMSVSPAYVRVASEKFSQKIVKEQLNLDSIVKIASDDIKDKATSSEHTQNEADDVTISDDWLNAFEKEAIQKSSDEMKMLFGKILAGEIRKPSSFSIGTIKLLSQLDNEAANKFHKLCSLSVSQRFGDYVHDARVVSLNGSASQNSLRDYGLGFDVLNVLSEYGLIISDYNSYMGYEIAVANAGKVSLPITYNDRKYGLVATDQMNHAELRLSGVAFTKSGKELLGIVDITPDEKYTTDLGAYFQAKKLNLVEIRT